jgi:hypothetical protein
VALSGTCPPPRCGNDESMIDLTLCDDEAVALGWFARLFRQISSL